MRVTVISDIHDNDLNLQALLDFCEKEKIENIICCGDLTNSYTLNILAQFSGQIFLVRGNADNYKIEDIEKYKNIKYWGEIGQDKIDKRSFGLCHEKYKIKSLPLNDLDIVFYGHSHKPWLEQKEKTIIANPGTLGGVLQKATFAVWETKNNTLQLQLI
jgi:hypothetical protein